jgi:hypothetical protein
MRTLIAFANAFAFAFIALPFVSVGGIADIVSIHDRNNRHDQRSPADQTFVRVIA